MLKIIKIKVILTQNYMYVPNVRTLLKSGDSPYFNNAPMFMTVDV